LQLLIGFSDNNLRFIKHTLYIKSWELLGIGNAVLLEQGVK